MNGIRESLQKLEKQMSPQAGITLEVDRRLMEEMGHLLDSFELSSARKEHIFGCYVLLQSAFRKHKKLTFDNPCLTKDILDGDYLQSFYYEYACKHGEKDFVNFLAPILKQIQIRLIQGKSIERILFQRIEKFLTKTEQQVTYEVS
ncbi:hypothetical protein O0550_01760 [Brevibacillus halotolerans]|uniref:hypothetical protein n=1 Tax=Brevibacillus TaxID=55080 RepID=UPI00215CB8B5|nr:MULTISPECIES: hypothetical protein [Brevibacillus]MCR8961939.1 hypothetical protein [Brevibacillus laterosporus]MCZ0834094.1 hypothetical protein [Brevibacillus halotolerans]